MEKTWTQSISRNNSDQIKAWRSQKIPIYIFWIVVNVKIYENKCSLSSPNEIMELFVTWHYSKNWLVQIALHKKEVFGFNNSLQNTSQNTQTPNNSYILCVEAGNKLKMEEQAGYCFLHIELTV